jgi:LysM repeat protein
MDANAYDLVAAVNALRASNGLPPLQMDGTLMASAQSHADYQASIGSWTHTGADGSNPRQRAYAAGFGNGATVFISENVAQVSPGTSLDTVLYSLWADAIHWNTMTNPQYTHIGGGVGVGSNYLFYTIDVGYIAGSPANYTPAATSGPGTVQPSVPTLTPELIFAVTTATPGPDGKIEHEILPGQALYSIAEAYGMTIQELAALNGLDINNPVIWAGRKLLIRTALPPTQTPTITATAPTVTRTPRPTYTITPTRMTPTASVTPTPTKKPLLPNFAPGASSGDRTIGIIIIVVCGLGLGMVVFGSLRSRKR